MYLGSGHCSSRKPIHRWLVLGLPGGLLVLWYRTCAGRCRSFTRPRANSPMHRACGRDRRASSQPSAKQDSPALPRLERGQPCSVWSGRRCRRDRCRGLAPVWNSRVPVRLCSSGRELVLLSKPGAGSGSFVVLVGISLVPSDCRSHSRSPERRIPWSPYACG